MGRDCGLSAAESSFLISMIGITNTVGRVISGYISDIKSVSPLVVNILAILISKKLTLSLIKLNQKYFRRHIPDPGVPERVLLDAAGADWAAGYVTKLTKDSLRDTLCLTANIFPTDWQAWSLPRCPKSV